MSVQTENALNRAIRRVQLKIAASEHEQLCIIAAAGIGSWEDAYALSDEELLRYRDDEAYDKAWETANYEHHEAYDQETGTQSALREVLAILHEEASNA